MRSRISLIGQTKGIQEANKGQQYKNIKNNKNIKKEESVFEFDWPNIQNLADLVKKV